MPFTMWRVLVWHDVLSSACGFVAALVRRGSQMMRVDRYDLGFAKTLVHSWQEIYAYL